MSQKGGDADDGAEDGCGSGRAGGDTKSCSQLGGDDGGYAGIDESAMGYEEPWMDSGNRDLGLGERTFAALRMIPWNGMDEH